jgi:uncharacterized protein (DUF1800 family)
MTIGPDQAGAVTALNRFGFGARPGDLDAAGGDPRGYLLEELRTLDVALISDQAPPSGPQALQAYYLEQQQRRAERMRMAATTAATRAGAPTAAMPPAALPMAPLPAVPPQGPSTAATPSGPNMASMAAVPPDGSSMAALAAGTPAVGFTAPHEVKLEAGKPAPAKPPVEQDFFRAEAAARLQKQLQARAGFVERLVAFWSNHFAVSAAKSGELRATAGPFEREAIRPNALGKFSALLRAAETHPADDPLPRQPKFDRAQRRAGKIRRQRPQ